MDNKAFSFYSNVFGLAVGMVSISGVLLGFCRSHLPSQRIKELEELLGETQCLYESAVEDGLLPDSMLRSQMEDRLTSLRDEMLKLRSRAYSATTLLKDYQEFFKGLSYDIAVACCDVKEIRASVTTTTEAERHRSGVHGGDYSTVRQSSSPELPPISCTMEMRSVPRPQSDLSDHSHAGCIIRHAAATYAHAPCGQHVIEVDLTELSDSAPATFPGRRISLDAASSFLTDQTTILQWNSDCPQDASPHVFGTADC